MQQPVFPGERALWMALVFVLFVILAVVLSVSQMSRYPEPNPLPPVTLPFPPATMPVPPTDGGLCTMDAEQCPDGSYVSRSGPNCEFAPCPGKTDTGVQNFETCRRAGYPVMESFPRRCAAGGITYTEENSDSLGEDGSGPVGLE